MTVLQQRGEGRSAAVVVAVGVRRGAPAMVYTSPKPEDIKRAVHLPDNILHGQDGWRADRVTNGLSMGIFSGARSRHTGAQTSYVWTRLPKQTNPPSHKIRCGLQRSLGDCGVTHGMT
jgi:hypothetical protein